MKLLTKLAHLFLGCAPYWRRWGYEARTLGDQSYDQVTLTCEVCGRSSVFWGSCTVWHSDFDGRRPGTETESLLSDIWSQRRRPQ